MLAHLPLAQARLVVICGMICKSTLCLQKFPSLLELERPRKASAYITPPWESPRAPSESLALALFSLMSYLIVCHWVSSLSLVLFDGILAGISFLDVVSLITFKKSLSSQTKTRGLLQEWI